MSTQYAGLQANVIRPSSINILSSTNTTPIAVTLTAAHGLMTGDRVVISGHLVNTAANGMWTVTVTGGSTFTLNSSVGNGVGGNTGSSTGTGFQAFGASNGDSSYSIPSDGDAENAASVNVALQQMGDRTVWLKQRVSPNYFLADMAFQSIGDTGTYPSLQWTSSSTADLFTQVTTSNPVNTATLTLLYPAIAGDVIVGGWMFNAQEVNSSSNGDFVVRFSEAGGAYVDNLASKFRFSTTPLMPINLGFNHLVSVTGTFSVQLWGASHQGGQTISTLGNMNMWMTRYSPVGS